MAAFHTFQVTTPGPTSESTPPDDFRYLQGYDFPDDIVTNYTFTSEDWEIWNTIIHLRYNEKMAYNYVEHFIDNRGYIESLKKDEWVKGEGNLVKPGSLVLAMALHCYFESVVELLLEHGVSSKIDDRVRKSLGLNYFDGVYSLIPKVIKRIKAKRTKNIKPACTKEEEVSDM
jgi:hypothetical protein